MGRAGNTFLTVFILCNAVFFAMFLYTGAQDLHSMDTGALADSQFYRFCSVAVDTLLASMRFLWESLPSNLRTDSMEWSLLLLIDIAYCAVITLILLPVMRLFRR